MQTTYTGEGVYSTYDDGTPVSMILDLSFKEIQPIYDIDYDAQPGNRGSRLLMGYFRELPDLRYPSFLSDKMSSLDYVEVKNIFRRAKLRDDLQNNFTVFDKYEIPMGARPDTVAEDLYGNAQFDWVVLTTKGIINVRNEWPLEDRDLYTYAFKKYGDALNSPRFFLKQLKLKTLMESPF